MDNGLKILEFLKTIEWIKSTLRHNWMVSWRQESVAEHTWRFVLFFILIQDIKKYDIDIVKTIKMILIHDIPELIDWDIPGFEKEKNQKKHDENELKNAKKIFWILPKPLDQEYLEIYLEFEEQKSKEARLAKALDKIETNLQHMESWPKYWSDKERWDHMINYPNKALEKLNEPFITDIWENIKKEIVKLTYE